MRILRLIPCIAMFASAPAQAELLRLPTRPGVTLPVTIESPSGPAAAWVLLFAGGDGALNLNEQGTPTSPLGQLYLIRNRQHLIAAGLGVALVDLPSDQQAGKTRQFRRSPEHAADIRALIGAIRQRFNRPVWIFGHSNGAISVATVVRNLTGVDRPDGVVLTSSTIIKARQSPDDPLAPFAYTGPVLVVTHQNDGCRLSPPSDAPKLLAAFAEAQPRAHRTMTGGSPLRGDPCHGGSPHSFLGIEAEALTMIVAFIRDPRP